ncbi:MAG: cyclic nucleotide-binding domain-containing protein [Spirochaetaceae bacterium]|nr:cyclic nucleotide-binding domain-containing protein [Spirochaetaceae bacterium]
MNTEKITNHLRIISQFKNLAIEEIDAISKVCIYAPFHKDEILFSEGDKADSVYLLIEGFVEIWKDFKSPTSDKLATQKSGNIVGEMAVIDELTRSATVVAGADMISYRIGRDDFISLLQRLPELSFEFMKSISMLVRMSNENFVSELRDKNSKLEKTNKKILQMQDELVKKERLSIVGQFSSMILHDIRNPVSVIKGYSDILLTKNISPEKVKNYAGAIQKEALSLNSLAGEMLDYSRGEIRLNLTITELDKLIEEVFSNIKKKLLNNTIKLESSIDYCGPVLLDYDRIFRVLVNLCDNSRKALYDGGTIKIEITGNDSFYHIRVIDDGDGINPENLDKIFDPFTSFSKAGGTGLGMLIVKNIIEAHEGTVNVLSEEHLGTTVIINLPMRN